MITPSHAAKMATYNHWMNQGIYAACDRLTDADRNKDCGAFFKSIHATLNHILWADQMWMHRLAGTPEPISPDIPGSLVQYVSYDDLKREHLAFDKVVSDWASSLDAADLEGDLTWHSRVAGTDLTKQRWVIVTHMFNHQSHHRGQVHCLLTQFGVETAVTDLAMMP